METFQSAQDIYSNSTELLPTRRANTVLAKGHSKAKPTSLATLRGLPSKQLSSNVSSNHSNARDTQLLVERMLGPPSAFSAFLRPGMPYVDKPGGICDSSEMLVAERKKRQQRRKRQRQLEEALVVLNCQTIEAVSKEREKANSIGAFLRSSDAKGPKDPVRAAREWVALKLEETKGIMKQTYELVGEADSKSSPSSMLRQDLSELLRTSSAPHSETAQPALEWDGTTSLQKHPSKLMRPGELPKSEIQDVHEVLDVIKKEGVHKAKPTNALTEAVCAVHLYGRAVDRSERLREVGPILGRVVLPVIPSSSPWACVMSERVESAGEQLAPQSRLAPSHCAQYTPLPEDSMALQEMERPVNHNGKRSLPPPRSMRLGDVIQQRRRNDDVADDAETKEQRPHRRADSAPLSTTNQAQQHKTQIAKQKTPHQQNKTVVHTEQTDVEDKTPEVAPAPVEAQQRTTTASTVKSEAVTEVAPAPVEAQQRTTTASTVKSEAVTEVAPAPVEAQQRTTTASTVKSEAVTEVAPAPVEAQQRTTTASTVKSEAVTEVAPAPVEAQQRTTTGTTTSIYCQK